MIESLEKKIDVLNRISEVDDRQFSVASLQPMDMQAFDATMDEKSALLDELNKLDEGFTTTYEMVKDEVQANPERYRDMVLEMQKLIREAVDKGVSIEAKEKRNKAAMESSISMKRKEMRTKKMSASAAIRYYNAVSKINNVDPQLMDRKK
jgi:hypothetical protein